MSDNGAPTIDLATEAYFQQRQQKIVDTYEGRIAKMRKDFQRELQNVVQSVQGKKESSKKSRFSFSFRKKFPDTIYIVFNHNAPVYCHKKSCPTRRPGFKHGIECITYDLDVAKEYIESYWQHHRGNRVAFVKLVEIDMTQGHGMVEREAVINELEWDASDKLKELLYAVPGSKEEE